MYTKIKIKRRLSKKGQDLSITNKNTKFWIPLSLMIPGLIFLLIFTIIPLWSSIWDSVSTKPENFNNFYNNLWSDDQWLHSVRNSFLFSIITLPISFGIAFLISGVIANLVRTKLRDFWQTVFFLPYVASSIAIAITFGFLLNQEYGFINKLFGISVGWLITSADDGDAGLWATVIYGVWNGLAFKILILVTAMLSVDKTLYDASSIDGVSSTKQFFKITIPSIESSIWYLFTISLIGSLKIFPLALYQNDPTKALTNSPTMLIYVYQKVHLPNYGLAGAASVMVLVLTASFNIFVKEGVKLLRFSSHKVNYKLREKRIDNITLKERFKNEH